MAQLSIPVGEIYSITSAGVDILDVEISSGDIEEIQARLKLISALLKFGENEGSNGISPQDYISLNKSCEDLLAVLDEVHSECLNSGGTGYTVDYDRDAAIRKQVEAIQDILAKYK